MVGGQVVDMESEGKDEIDLATHSYIHTHKTGALIRASVRAGAHPRRRRPGDPTALTTLRRGVGLAFQIADDILDMEGPRKNSARMREATRPAARRPTRPWWGWRPPRPAPGELVEMALAASAPFGRAGRAAARHRHLHREEEIDDAGRIPFPASERKPAQLKGLTLRELRQLAGELRARDHRDLCQATAGTWPPASGVVELTIALHRVFDTPEGQDRLGRRAPGLRAQAPDR